jgi:Cysteine-rich CPXCG
MSDEFSVTCPYCGEQIEIYLEPDVQGTLIQDCEVCCHPCRMRVSGSGDERQIEVTRSDE